MKKKLKKTLFVLATLSIFNYTHAAFAYEKNCYQLSRNPNQMSRTPELLCVESNDPSSTPHYLITLREGLNGEQVVATFNYDLISTARCMECNQNVFGVTNPENSIFNAFVIRFDGKREASHRNREEKGTIFIGKEKFFYLKAQLPE